MINFPPGGLENKIVREQVMKTDILHDYLHSLKWSRMLFHRLSPNVQPSERQCIQLNCVKEKENVYSGIWFLRFPNTELTFNFINFSKWLKKIL